MNKFVFLGPESSGKSSLSKWLVQQLPNSLWLPEYTRIYCEQFGTDTDIEDVKKIAQGQIEQEMAWQNSGCERVVLDTNLISNYLWSLILFQEVPDIITKNLPLLQDAYYFVCHPEGLIWQEDAMRCQPNVSARLAFFDLNRDYLEQHALAHQVLTGSFEHRQKQLQDFFQ